MKLSMQCITRVDTMLYLSDLRTNSSMEVKIESTRDFTISSAISLVMAVLLPLVSIALAVVLLLRWHKTRQYREMS